MLRRLFSWMKNGGRGRSLTQKWKPNTNKRSRGTKQILVVGVIDRENKKIYVEVALPNEEDNNLQENNFYTSSTKFAEKEVKTWLLQTKFMMHT